MGDSGQKIRILSQILEFLAQFLPEITPSGLTDTFDDALETTVRSAQQTLGRTVTGEVTPADWLAFYRAALSLGQSTRHPPRRNRRRSGPVPP